MDIVFFCRHCGQKLAVDERAKGLAVTCPTCHRELTVPNDAAASRQASEPKRVVTTPPVIADEPVPAPTRPRATGWRIALATCGMVAALLVTVSVLWIAAARKRAFEERCRADLSEVRNLLSSQQYTDALQRAEGLLSRLPESRRFEPIRSELQLDVLKLREHGIFQNDRWLTAESVSDTIKAEYEQSLAELTQCVERDDKASFNRVWANLTARLRAAVYTLDRSHNSDTVPFRKVKEQLTHLEGWRVQLNDTFLPFVEFLLTKKGYVMRNGALVHPALPHDLAALSKMKALLSDPATSVPQTRLSLSSLRSQDLGCDALVYEMIDAQIGALYTVEMAYASARQKAEELKQSVDETAAGVAALLGGALILPAKTSEDVAAGAVTAALMAGAAADDASQKAADELTRHAAACKSQASSALENAERTVSTKAAQLDQKYEGLRRRDLTFLARDGSETKP